MMRTAKITRVLRMASVAFPARQGDRVTSGDGLRGAALRQPAAHLSL